MNRWTHPTLTRREKECLHESLKVRTLVILVEGDFAILSEYVVDAVHGCCVGQG